ncbi:MAG: gliding motility-associated C-terminal domain-containing protein [Crocinitomicaceae bacterium]|nr:gliding motility-associated C-terminal domain-containing protein [Flavobacteriales bacterium]NQZ37589.1 gliding motility-associated C-terminal domain-containing protein [Crocinitomicaceae bacterium]
MFTRLLLCSLALLSTASSLFAQWDWIDNSVSGSFEGVTDLAVDEVRDVIYSVGYFDGAANFPEIGLSHGSEDGFVMKYDLAGNVLWAFAIGGSGNDRINGVAIEETTGNIFITGFIEGSFATNATSLQGTPGGTSGNVTGFIGGEDAFVACYNLLGQLIWKKIIGGSDVDRGMDITVNVGGVYATGFYANTSGLSSITSIIPTNGDINHFVIALNVSNGNTLWDAVLGSSVDDYDIPLLNSTIRRTGISSDANNVYVVTYFNGAVYNVYDGYDVLSATIADPNASTQDFVATSFTNIGNHNWSVLYDNVGAIAAGIDVTSDCSGVYVSGTLHDNGSSPGGVTINSVHDNFFISKLDKTNGTEIWLKEFDSKFNHEDYFVGIDADGYGNLYAVGRLRGMDVDLGMDLNYSGGQNYSEVMIAHFHTDGVFQSFEVIPSNSAAWGMSIASYKNEKYVVGGYYNNTIAFDALVPNPSLENAFIATRNLPEPLEYVSASGDSLFCQSEVNPDPILNLPIGGTFSGPIQIVFENITTGKIDLMNSTPGGPYTITYSGYPLACTVTPVNFEIYIVANDDASFTYSTDHFCNNESNPIPTSIATLGGTFTAPTGLVLANNSTGEIDVAASTVGGPYYLVYTTNGVICPNSDSLEIYIEDAPDPTFAYAQSSFCTGSGTIFPSSVTVPGGTFSGPLEIIFVNSVTGEIDISASTIGGPYTIQYVASNTYCQDSTTFSLTIDPTEDASFTYSATHFCYNEANPLPTSVTTPGGTFSGTTDFLLVNSSTGEIDVAASTIGGPYYLVYTTDGSTCVGSDSIQVYIESGPNPSFSYAQSIVCMQSQSGTITPNSVAVPGGTFSGPSEIVFVNTTTGEIDINASTIGGPYLIEYFVSNTYCQKSATFDIMIVGQDDLVSVDYSTSEYCVSDVNQIPVINGASSGVFSGPTSIDIVNSTTGEFSPSTSYAGGPYLIKYVTLGTCPDSIELFLTIYDLPLAAYAGEDQELFFILTSTLEGDLPIMGDVEWSTLSSALIADEFDPNSDVSNLSLGKNTFTWTVTNGACPSVSDDINIVVQDLFIPQAVTPNGDGKNDFFEFYSIDAVTCSLHLYNRWGQVVYENSDYQNEWFGQSFNGEELENDTYFYVILIDDSISFNGYVVLKK